MTKTTYDYNKVPVNLSFLVKEIKTAGLTVLDRCVFNEDETPNNLHVIFPDSLSAEDKTTLDNVVLDHGYVDLEDYKQAKIAVIDKRTCSFIEGGFSFDGKMFETDTNAQFNWKNMYDLTNSGIMTFPVDSVTMDDVAYQFSDQTAVNNFYLTGVSFVQSYLESGRTLKYQVKSATTKAEVDAIVDTR